MIDYGHGQQRNLTNDGSYDAGHQELKVIRMHGFVTNHTELGSGMGGEC